MQMHREFILGRVGHITVAVPAERIQTIVRDGAAHALENAGELTAMMAVMSGIAVPIFDARTAVGLAPHTSGQKQEIAFAGDTHNLRIGIAFDEVVGVHICEQNELSSTEAVKLSRYPYISDVCTYNGGTVLLLDIDMVIATRIPELSIAEINHQHAV
ncbi:MAG: chemotaxis protein CheW [Spirochaetota bacterium]